MPPTTTTVPPAVSMPSPYDDEFYLADAIGRPVQRERDGVALGTIVGVTSNGVQDLLEVQYTRKDGRKDTWLLPALPQFIVDVDDARMQVELPLGLLPDEFEANSP